MGSGGARNGSGRKKLNENKKANYSCKSIKFKDSEQFLIDYVNQCEGKNFSDKLKKLIIKNFEKK